MRHRTLIGLAALAAVSACDGAGPFGPIEPDDVFVTMSVSGGIAGVSWHVEVDGADGVVRVVCERVCSLLPGPRIFPLSDAQIEELATRIEQAGFLALDGIDFGTQCCDQFGVVLEYASAAGTARAEGTQSLWPAALVPVLDRLFALADWTVPILVEPGTEPSNWPSDALTLGEIELDGLTLEVELSYGGGCGEHRIDLVAWGGWMESFPVQVNALITHDDADDPCDAIVNETRRFDLTPLREAYVEAYGPIGAERPTVRLRLQGPDPSTPVTVEIEL